MEIYFKHEYGFVNIDRENFYFTNSGNWSETKNLSEKSNGHNLKLNVRKIRIIIFFSIAILAFLVLFIYQFAVFSKIALGLPIAGYFLYKYFQHDMSAAFKIPVKKIDSIEKIDKNYLISFRNKEGKPDSVELTNIEEKGERFLNELNWKGHS